MTLDFTRPITTRNGRAVRILCQDGPGVCPIIGIIEGSNGPTEWYADGSPQGSFGASTGAASLINPPVKRRRGWVVLTKHPHPGWVTTRNVFDDEIFAKKHAILVGGIAVQLPEWEE